VDEEDNDNNDNINFDDIDEDELSGAGLSWEGPDGLKIHRDPPTAVLEDGEVHNHKGDNDGGREGDAHNNNNNDNNDNTPKWGANTQRQKNYREMNEQELLHLSKLQETNDNRDAPEITSMQATTVPP
jgi:hypothetical protein